MNKYTTALLQNNLMLLAFPYIFSATPWPMILLSLKILKPPISKASRKEPKNTCKIYFLNKDVAHITVPHILHVPPVKA